MRDLAEHNASVIANRSDDPPDEDEGEDTMTEAEHAAQADALVIELAYEARLVKEALGEGGWLEWEAKK